MYAESSGISSALVVDGAVYSSTAATGLRGSSCRQAWARPPRPGNRAFEGLKGIFLTHLHSDHIVDFPAFPLTGMWNGLDDPTKPVQVYGPGDRGGLPPVFGNRPARRWWSPPTPRRAPWA